MAQRHDDRLIELAEEAGYPEADFTEAEKKLFESLANGVEADCAEDPEDQRTIRAELFEWLLTDRDAAEQFRRPAE